MGGLDEVVDGKVLNVLLLVVGMLVATCIAVRIGVRREMMASREEE